MGNKSADIFGTILKNDEKVIWTGKPEIRKMFSFYDRFLIPISIILAALLFLYEFMAISNLFYSLEKYDRIVFNYLMMFCIGSLFTIFGVYFLIGRFIVKMFIKKNTFYAITDNRIIIIRNGFHNKVKAKDINQLKSMDLSEIKNGVGTISFYKLPPIIKIFNNGVLEIPFVYHYFDIFAFYDINEVEKTCEIVKKLNAKI